METLIRIFSRLLGGDMNRYALCGKNPSGKDVFRLSCRYCEHNAPHTDCLCCKSAAPAALSDRVFEHHINGEAPVGIFPFSRDGLCRFSVISLKDESAAFLRPIHNACLKLELDFFWESLRGGREFRLWLFAGEDVSPHSAVYIAERVLLKAAAGCVDFPWELFDKVYPKQGLPVLLPLFDLNNGTTFIIDKKLHPVEDPIKYFEDFSPGAPALKRETCSERAIEAELCGSYYIKISSLAPAEAELLCEAAAFIAPDLSIKRCFSISGGWLRLPGGLNIKDTLPNVKIISSGDRVFGKVFKLHNRLSLSPWQQSAAEKALKEGRGMITAPVGSGKTGIVCRIIAHLNTSLLLLVPDSVTAARWQRKLSEAFSLERKLISCVRNEYDRPNGFMDIAVINEKTEYCLAEYIESYGCVIAADCDRLMCGGEIFARILDSICTEHVYGISARNSDNAQLREYIRLYIGKTIINLS